MSALWSSNCFAPIAANVDKYKQQLTTNEIGIIETLTGEYMDRYGYQRMTDADVLVTGETQAAARERSEIAKGQAWREMEHANFRDYTLRRYRADYLAKVRNRLELGAAAAAGNRQIVKLDELDPAAFDVTD